MTVTKASATGTVSQIPVSPKRADRRKASGITSKNPLRQEIRNAFPGFAMELK